MDNFFLLNRFLFGRRYYFHHLKQFHVLLSKNNSDKNSKVCSLNAKIHKHNFLDNPIISCELSKLKTLKYLFMLPARVHLKLHTYQIKNI